MGAGKRFAPLRISKIVFLVSFRSTSEPPEGSFADTTRRKSRTGMLLSLASPSLPSARNCVNRSAEALVRSESRVFSALYALR